MPITSSSLIHETALISAEAKLDPSVQVGAYSIIKDNAVIGKNVIIGSHCIIGAEPFDDLTQMQWGVEIKVGAWIGDHVQIQNGVARNTHIDENSSINHGCYIGHDMKIGQDCMIGLSVTISGHSNLGENFRRIIPTWSPGFPNMLSVIARMLLRSHHPQHGGPNSRSPS